MGTKAKHSCQLQLLPPSTALNFIAMDILDPVPRIHLGNQFEVIITDSYSKLTRNVPTQTVSSTHVTYIFSAIG